MPDSHCLSNTPTSNDRARRTEPFARCPGASRYRCRRLAQGKRRSDGHCLPTGRGRAALHSAYGPPPLRTHGLARPPDAPKLLSDLQLVHAPCSLLRPLVYRQPELMVAYLQEPNVPSDPASPPQPSVGDRSWGSRRRNHGSTPAQVDRRPPTHGFLTSRPSSWRRPPSPLRQRWPRLRSAGTTRHLSSLTPTPPSCEAQGRSCAVWQRCGELPPNRYADPALAATDDLGSGDHVAERLDKVP